MPEYQTIRYQKEHGVAVITLSRPQRLNAMSIQLLRETGEVLDQVEKDKEARAIIITGAPRPDGSPCFCSGADLKEIVEGKLAVLGRSEEDITHLIESVWKGESVDEIQRILYRIETFSKPTIAAIDGVCTAGGLELALCCDLRVVSETAQISDLHIKNLGSIGGAGATPRLARLVGPAKAKELVFTGDPIDGHEAYRIGLANQVFPPDRFMEEATELARKIAGMRPEAVRLAKASINATSDMCARQALNYSHFCAAVLARPPMDAAKASVGKTKADSGNY